MMNQIYEHRRKSKKTAAIEGPLTSDASVMDLNGDYIDDNKNNNSIAMKEIVTCSKSKGVSKAIIISNNNELGNATQSKRPKKCSFIS